MKLDRLLSIVMILINRNCVSAKELSDYFEVSIRTIYRDIEAINQAGIPIISYQGVNGGFSIIDSYRIERHLLTTDDILSIITALKGVSTIIDDEKISATLDNVTGLISNHELNEIECRNNQVVFDFSQWGGSKKEKDKLKIINKAINKSRIIYFLYSNLRGETIERKVEPMTTVFKESAWYLYGYCRIRNDYRIFKLSRMKNLKISEDEYVRREKTSKNFPWESEWWKESQIIELKMKFSPRVRVRVEDFFDEDRIQVQENGSVLVKVHYLEDEWLYRFILSYGEDVVVLEPKHLREKIKEKARKTWKLYLDNL